MIEMKSMSNHFDVPTFKRACATKGYTVVHVEVTAAMNSRATAYLKAVRKNPDPIDSITVNLKVNGANVAAVKEITGKELNSKRFEIEIVKNKNKANAPRPSTGKKQFTQHFIGGGVSSIFN